MTLYSDVIGLVLHLQEKVLVETKTSNQFNQINLQEMVLVETKITKISRSLTAEFVDSTNTEVRLHSLFNYRGTLISV